MTQKRIELKTIQECEELFKKGMSLRMWGVEKYFWAFNDSGRGSTNTIYIVSEDLKDGLLNNGYKIREGHTTYFIEKKE